MAASKKNRKNAATAEETSPTFDKFDLAILRELLADSRRTLQDIGQAVKLSPTTCWTRIKRLEAEGVIRKYSIELDRARLGWRDAVAPTRTARVRWS